MPVSAGNLRTAGFAELWRSSSVFGDLRDPKLGGRCGALRVLEEICGGCRAGPTATTATISRKTRRAAISPALTAAR